MKFVVVGEHRVVSKVLDEMQVHHGGLYAGMPELLLHEHDGFDAVAVPVALQGDQGVCGVRVAQQVRQVRTPPARRSA